MRKLNKLGKAVVGTVAGAIITVATVAYAGEVVDRANYKADFQEQQHIEYMNELHEAREENTIDWNYINE